MATGRERYSTDFTHAPLTFGMIGVDGFFLLSGYLIVKSWMSFFRLSDFMWKRVLRIVPGYAVAVLLSTLAVGLLAPGEELFFRHLNSHFIHSVVLLENPSTPAVFPGLAYPYVNGALYTIAYEFRCYLLVAIVGALGILRVRTVWLAATVCTLAAFGCSRWLLQGIHWPSRILGVFGEPHLDLRLTAVFLVGGCFYLFRDRIPSGPRFPQSLR
jgi:peptidoglycan/LPS O-acetylase OafA/YrhL